MSETALWATQTHYVADVEETPLATTDSVDESTPPGGLWLEAWRTLRRRPLFIVSSVIILGLVMRNAFCGLVASKSPTFCHLRDGLAGDLPGPLPRFFCRRSDIDSRVIHGARASV